jgi:hypothetical protein
VIDIIDNSEVTVSSTSAAGVREQKLSANQQTEPSSDYIRTKFPTFFAENVTHTLTEFFVGLLPADPRIEHIYWDWDETNVYGHYSALKNASYNARYKPRTLFTIGSTNWKRRIWLRSGIALAST